MPITCPKCHHTRSAHDDPLIPDYQCPACGVVYAKVARHDLSDDVMNNIRRSRERPENLQPAVLEENEKLRDDSLRSRMPSFESPLIDPKMVGVVSILVLGGLMFSWVLTGYEQQSTANKLQADKKTAEIRASEERRIANNARAEREREESRRMQQESTRIIAEKAQNKCLADAKCTFLGLNSMPRIDCQKMVEKQSKWSFKWTDGISENKFDRFAWVDAAHSAIYAAGDHVQFQNGFGAVADMKYICEVDAKTGAIKNVTVQQGRF